MTNNLFKVAPTQFFKSFIAIALCVVFLPCDIDRGKLIHDVDLRKWVIDVISQVKKHGADHAFAEISIPGEADEISQIQLMKRGVAELEGSVAKNICLKVLVEKFGQKAFPPLVELAKNNDLDDEVRTKIMHLLAVFESPDAKEFFESCLDDEAPKIRAAAIDALGILLFPIRHLLDPETGAAHVDWRIPINVSSIYSPYTELEVQEIFDHWHELHAQSMENAQKLIPNLIERVYNGEPEERDAVARLMVNSPPNNYQLRIAEWGVWINDDGKYKLIESVLDEIPPHVHRTQNRLADLKKRVKQVVGKPIIHITTNRPMSIHLSASIRGGQPWFVYPKPHNFIFYLEPDISSDDAVDEHELDDEVVFTDQLVRRLLRKANGNHSPIEFLDFAGRYPWLQKPSEIIGRRGYYLGAYAHPNGILTEGVTTAIGVEWQNLLVMPAKQSWMELHQIENGKFQWWQRLREVDSSWVYTRGDSERFVFYDGPTTFSSKYHAEIQNDEVAISIKEKDRAHPFMEAPRKKIKNRLNQGLFVSVDEDGTISGQLFSVNSAVPAKDEKPKTTTLSFAVPGDLSGREEVRDAFMHLIQSENGLTESEANGMLAAWDAEFFQQPGRRVLFRMDREEYNFACPMAVYPMPTEISRVGIVLTNLK